MKKKRLLKELEIIVDTLIPYLVIVLLFMIIFELFFHEEVAPYYGIIIVLDYFIIAVFVIDLYFKWIRIRNVKKFLKSSWLDILAVFPFFLLFRVYEEVALIFRVTSTEFRQGQSIFHELVELEKGAGRWTKEATRLAQEAERVGKISRSRYILRIIRPVARIPRLVKIIPFFERPAKKHR